MEITKRKLIMVVAVASMLALAGCAGEDTGSQGAEEIANDTNEDISTDEVGQSYWYEVGITESNQQHLVRERPPFTMDDSLERQNLIRRYEYLNDQNNVHHVYMLSNDGKVINYEVAQGKVSSVNSKLTNDAQIVASEQCIDTAHHDSEGSCFKTVESPQMDGSYGSNGNAIFFFTTDGHYVEYNGIYVVSEQPKEITTEVTLVEEVDSDN